MKASKGSAFEREICRLLSKWWTCEDVPPRDDIFWRTSQSGGRATFRASKGKATFGSYGDITAIDPIGLPLLKVFSIELKRGRSHGQPGELMDTQPTTVVRPWEKTLLQTIRGRDQSKALYWMLIYRRDHRVPMVCVDWNFFLGIEPILGRGTVLRTPMITFREYINTENSCIPVKYGCMKLEHFLDRVSPESIQCLLQE